MHRLKHLYESEDHHKKVSEAVLNRWLHDPIMEAFFEKYGMDRDYFETHYAPSLTNLSEYGSDTAFAAQHLVEYLKNRDVTLSDLDKLFSTYRRALLRVMVEHGKNGPDEIDILLSDTDIQRQQALEHYAHSTFADEPELRKEMTRFREYQKAIDRSSIVSKTDKSGIITYVNEAFCSISGYTHNELIGSPHSIVRHPDVSEKLYQQMWDKLKAKKIFRGVIKNRSKNGKAYYVDATIIPILDEENEIIEYIGLRYDITQLQETLEKVKIAQRAKDEFLANISHEIRTPLNAIMGFIPVLRRYLSDEKGKQYLEVMEQSSHMLLERVNDILDLSRLQSGKMTVHPAPFDPMVETSASVALFSSRALEKSIRYIVYIDPAIPLCLQGDRTRIKQVLSNFLSNAIKFTPAGGVVKVKVEYFDGELKVMVQDNGIGIKPEKHALIFEAFEQADGSISRHFEGTGLGLSISKELVALMGGKITFRSAEKKGSLFGFTIPMENCTKPGQKRFDPKRYQDLRVAIATEAFKQDELFLIQKYLSAFGVLSIQLVTDVKEGMFDLVYCREGSRKIGQIIALKTVIAIVHKNHSQGYDLYPHITSCTEPLLPLEIQVLLEKVISQA